MKKIVAVTAGLFCFLDPTIVIIVATVAALPGTIPVTGAIILIFKSRGKILCQTGLHKWKHIHEDDIGIKHFLCQRNCSAIIIVPKDAYPSIFYKIKELLGSIRRRLMNSRI